MGSKSEYLTAAEAAGFLEVKRATLYAYASRGLVRSVPGDRGRERRYLRADLERLRARRDARAGHGPVAAGALRWGEPVLDSAITSLDPVRGPSYRGRLALDLAARDVPFEQVAELLWTSTPPDVESQRAERVRYLWGARGLGLPVGALRELVPSGLPPLPALTLVVPLLASRDPGRFVERADAVAPKARTLILRMAACLALGSPSGSLEAALAAEGVASTVAAAVGVAADAQSLRAINRALVLLADHELNASTFAARIAASTGADIYACVQAALATLSGPRHGGAADRIEALLAEVGAPEDAERVVHDRARRGESVEGFGHPLYAQGDPRAAFLLELAVELASDSPVVRTCCELVAAVDRRDGARPTVDLGLVALAAALGLRPGSAAGLFAVGRAAGWVAHALEHYQAGYLLRPRARYLSPR